MASTIPPSLRVRAGQGLRREQPRTLIPLRPWVSARDPLQVEPVGGALSEPLTNPQTMPEEAREAQAWIRRGLGLRSS